MNRSRFLGAAMLLATAPGSAGERGIDLTNSVVVVRDAQRGQAEKMAATILVEEVEKRSGIRLAVQSTWPADRRPAIAITVRDGECSWSGKVPRREGADLPESRPEGFLVRVIPAGDQDPPGLLVAGADGRGAMYGVGKVLRTISITPGAIEAPASFLAAEAPQYPIRGHQLGYRARANSYDAWTPERYEQYIRELAIFGANSIENIPFEDSMPSPHMPVSREVMNRRLSEICARYDLDYWVWTPADFSLTDAARRAAGIEEHRALYRACPRLNGVFFPGGDPGSNPPELIISYLEDLAPLLAKEHPRARIWVSLQGFDRPKAEAFLSYVERKLPEWLGGLVAGPSSPPIPETRVRLPGRYGLRWYPDITHTVRCQFPLEWWDPAFALTLGREPVNPRPVDSAATFRLFAPRTSGFLSYSDGMHDDVNKAVWSLLAWDSRSDARAIMIEYARFFFGAAAAEEGADGLLGLEANWRGPLSTNGAVDGVLGQWIRMEERFPKLREEWRFQMHLFRAYYDAYTRHRLIEETALEKEGMEVLREARNLGASVAMDRAASILRRAETAPCRPEWRKRIDELADSLFRSIGYQTSVEKYHASGAERGAVMDFIDSPLNNRWWIEDEFAKIRALPAEADKLARLEVIRTWEDPGPGSYYDEVGHVGKSPHVIRGETVATDPELDRHDTPEHSWWDNGRSRRRLSWQHHMRWPAGLWYPGLDPQAKYTVRVTGQGDCRPRADGVALTPTRSSREIGEFKEFPVPAELTADGKLLLTFDPIDESGINWRQQSHVAEIWLLKEGL